jgi:hypothetical protein
MKYCPVNAFSLFFVIILCNFYGIFGYCIYNELSNTNLWVKRYDGSYSEALGRDRDSVKTITPNNKYCCRWKDAECYQHRNMPASAGQFGYVYLPMSVDAKWDYVTVPVACSKKSKVYTMVEFPAGGYMIVKQSPTGEDNYIDVYGHLGDKKWWYRCGTRGQWFSY